MYLSRLTPLAFSTFLLLPNLAQAELRPLAADRPDATESPQTVDKGYFQLETSLLSYRFNDSSSTQTTSWSAMESNLKYGLTDNMDLQFVFSPRIEQQSKTSSQTTHTTSYMEDTQIRAKINLWGNDSGDQAMAIMPYIKLPSGQLSNHEYEAGLILTYATLIQGYGVGLQAQVDYLYDDANKQHDWAWSHTAVMGYDISKTVAGYVEYIGEVNVANHYTPYASGGFTWQTSRNLQWDLGTKMAIRNPLQDNNLFTGVTYRF